VRFQESRLPIFLILYDLPQKLDVDYPQLIPMLTRLGAKRLTATAWAVRTSMPKAELRDEIQINALPGDRFVIAQISDWRSMGTINRIDDL
jgi:hypothetical protein